MWRRWQGSGQSQLSGREGGCRQDEVAHVGKSLYTDILPSPTKCITVLSQLCVLVAGVLAVPVSEPAALPAPAPAAEAEAEAEAHYGHYGALAIAGMWCDDCGRVRLPGH